MRGKGDMGVPTVGAALNKFYLWSRHALRAATDFHVGNKLRPSPRGSASVPTLPGLSSALCSMFPCAKALN